MVPRGGVTSTLTFLLTAIAPSYAALPMHCVYVCGNCNLTPMALCDATEAVGPGLPPRSTPCGASGAQSFDTCDRALGLNVSTWAPSTRNTSCQGLASADDAQDFFELAKDIAAGSLKPGGHHGVAILALCKVLKFGVPTVKRLVGGAKQE